MFDTHTDSMRLRLLTLICGVGSAGLLVGCYDKIGEEDDTAPATIEEITQAWESEGYDVTCFTEGTWKDEVADGECPAQSELETGCCNPALEPAVLVEGECCFPADDSGCCGRPLYVDGDARKATLARRADWLHDAAAIVVGLDDAARAVLSAAWAAEALMEHASVASFARFTLDLLAFGAPPDLVADAQRAGMDEVDHAQRCFALATAYGGSPVGPSGLSMAGVAPSASLAEAAAAAVVEACVGETIAAMEAQVRAAAATDPSAREALLTIAEDEARHAELGWRFVKWALQQGDPTVHAAVRVAFEEALAHARPDDSPDRLPPALLRAHGRLPAADRMALRARVVAHVLQDCRAALFATSSSESSGELIPPQGSPHLT